MHEHSFFTARRGASLAAPFAALLALAACSSSSDTIRVGAAGPWSLADNRLQRQGLELAAAEINASRGRGGQRLELVFADDSGAPAVAVRVAEQFLADRSMIAVVGHVNSSTTAAASALYRGRLPSVAATASSPNLTALSPWLFRVVPSDSVGGAALGRFAGRLGERGAVLYENDTYGRGLADAFRRAYPGRLLTVDPVDRRTTDFEPFVSYYRARGVQMVFVAGTDEGGTRFLREARRQGLGAALVGGDGWLGIGHDTANAEGVYVGVPFAADDPRPAARRFVAAFEARYHEAPDASAALAYDALQLVARAASTTATREGVQRYLAGPARTTAYQGVTGPIRLRADGDPEERPITVLRVRNGALSRDAAL